MIELHCGDCLPFMQAMADGQIDCVLTDPPYGIDIASNPFRQKYAKSDWDSAPASDEHIRQARRVSRSQIIWGGNYFDLPQTRCFLVWNKQQAFEFSSAMVEMAWTNFDRPAKMFTWFAAKGIKQHPTQKPLALMEWVLLNYTAPGDTVFDPFMGSGTTGVACVKTGRNFIGCEIEPAYYAIAEKRIAEAQLQIPMPEFA